MLNDRSKKILDSRKPLMLLNNNQPPRVIEEEGGCGVVGFVASEKVKGRHIFEPSIQMHNRGNGKGGGIAATGLDPDFLGVSREILDECYLIQIALLDPSVLNELENKFINPFFDVCHSQALNTIRDFRELELDTKPPDVRQYFARVKPGILANFATELGIEADRVCEDEFVWRNSFKINQCYYASMGDQKAFVLSHARDLMILKIVGYAENVVKYYQLDDMKAHVWIAHQRYPTKGRVWHPGGAHPFIGMNEALVHNGDFANYHSVAEYLKQRNMTPQFLTDTEVSVMIFDLWNRIYQYPLEYVIEALAPTTELDFDRLPPEKQKIYRAIQAAHIHGSPDGPWFFIVARSAPDKKEFQLLGITDTSMLRPQVFAFSDGPVQIGLCGSEKQAIDATLLSLSKDDSRFRPIADKYWNARGGSHNDGGAFVFKLKQNDGRSVLTCENKFGVPVTCPDKKSCDFSVDFSGVGSKNLEDEIKSFLNLGNASELVVFLQQKFLDSSFELIRWMVDIIVVSSKENGQAIPVAIDTLSGLLDLRYDLGDKKRSAILEILHEAICGILKDSPNIDDESNLESAYRLLNWRSRHNVRAPRANETVLVIDALGFQPEGDDCDAVFLVKAAELGWKRFIVFNLHGQRFHGSGLGLGSQGVRIDLYSSSGDYVASGMDGAELYIHGDAQDQLGQILKSGTLVVYGTVGQTFLYGAKGGDVFVMGNAAGRPLINAVGNPKVVINGTCLDFLAESFMAGDVFNDGGFVIVNGMEFDDAGRIHPLEMPYPGSNLFSLASGGALYIRDPKQTLVPQQLNQGKIVELTDRDWEIIHPYLQRNEALFNITVNDLLTVDGELLTPEKVYCKIVPVKNNE